MFVGFALDLFSSVPELAWSKAGRAQVVVASCSLRFSSVFIIFSRVAVVVSSSPPSVPHLPMSKHSRMISVLIRRRRKKKFCFLRWSWSCGYHGCYKGMRYTCFFGREGHDLTKNHHGAVHQLNDFWVQEEILNVSHKFLCSHYA